MLPIQRIHHIAIIVGDYDVSKYFYTKVLGFKIVREIYREARQSYKLDLSVNGQYQIELFSFPETPERPSRPEARGLRHLAFEVVDIEATHEMLLEKGVSCEAIRIDEFTEKAFFFIEDPDGLPLEFYEA